jgi:hypothetical protein
MKENAVRLVRLAKTEKRLDRHFHTNFRRNCLILAAGANLLPPLSFFIFLVAGRGAERLPVVP